MGSKHLAWIMVLAVVAGTANAGRHLASNGDEGLGTPLPLPKQEDDIAPQPQPQPSVVPELPEKEEEKEFTFYMHHSLGVTSGAGAGGGLNGNGGGPLQLTFPLGALLNNPNNLGNGLGLGGLGGIGSVGLSGGGALLNGANGLGVGGLVGGSLANSLGGLGSVGLTNPNFAGGLGLQGQLGGANGGLGLQGQLGGANGGAGLGYEHMVMLEEPITHDSYEGSPAMGIAQGYYMEMESSHEHEHEQEHDHNMLAMSFTASLHDGEYSGSFVQLAGQINTDGDDEDSKGNGGEKNVVQVVGGSSVFEKAIGHHALVHIIPSIHQEHGLLFKISIPL